MDSHDIIVIGASAGGVEALQQVAAGLPPDLPASLFVVLHTPATGTSSLPRILSRAGPLPAEHARDRQSIRPGHIYVAVPDTHLVLEEGLVRLRRGPREHSLRPAADVLFRSAALCFGERVVGVLLSGTLDDGTLGLMAIKAHGGRTVVQDPEEALFPGMPRSAIANVPIDHVLRVAEIPGVLDRLARERVQGAGERGREMTDDSEQARAMIGADFAPQERGERHHDISVLTCPECGGVLWQFDQSRLTSFHCHVGHVYSLRSLLHEQAERLEEALWTAIRSLKEKKALARQMLASYSEGQESGFYDHFRRQAEAAGQHAELLRRLVENPALQDSPAITLAADRTSAAAQDPETG